MRKYTILSVLCALMMCLVACNNSINPNFPELNSMAEWVDLGLSVKWATCNVGANTPEDYGNFYAWGETSTKSRYGWSTYKYGSSSMSKYCTNSDCGSVDNRTTLMLSDDVAHVVRGGSWRMPTEAEWTELRNKCTWKPIVSKGVYGCRVTGKNGNSIFLPAAGYMDSTNSYKIGEWGYYWSSTLHPSDSYQASVVYFNSQGVGKKGEYRDYGYSVRPVMK